ncbi:hypothetical protein D3C85_1234870 [compost metagenome]
MHQRTGDHQTALHTAGEHPRTFAALFPQFELFEVLFAALDCVLTLNTVITGLVNDDLLYGFKRVEVELLRHQSQLTLGVHNVFIEVITKYRDAAGRFIHQ